MAYGRLNPGNWYNANVCANWGVGVTSQILHRKKYQPALSDHPADFQGNRFFLKNFSKKSVKIFEGSLAV